MSLFYSILASGILGVLLLFIAGPFVGGLIAFAIVAGCIFRGLYLLADIHKSLSVSIPKKDVVEEAYEKYLKERDSKKTEQ
ncbi:hypothetical protein [Litchfieldia alkalitelluris]|uniref:hypothetical protein n=1 Tax=Litchfieldia alkalitelluris TaxID=304268 RepID=UPI00099722E2|nr:hypothetical protein [Litchfieldia alkalitelluris]